MSHVKNLGLRYGTILDQLGSSEFTSERPHITVELILNDVSHEKLRTKIQQFFRMRKEEFRKKYGFFMSELTSEARGFDTHEYADTVNLAHDTKFETILVNGAAKKNERESRLTRKTKFRNLAGHAVQHDGSSSKKKRNVPDCFNPKCPEKHFVDACRPASNEDNKTLLQDYQASKKN